MLKGLLLGAAIGRDSYQHQLPSGDRVSNSTDLRRLAGYTLFGLLQQGMASLSQGSVPPAACQIQCSGEAAAAVGA